MIGCDPHWVPLDGQMIRVCKRCAKVSAVVTQRPPLAAIQACTSTDMRPADDWNGCVD
jgi:hypothetical protein